MKSIWPQNYWQHPRLFMMAAMLGLGGMVLSAPPQAPVLFGTLMSDPKRAVVSRQAGIPLASLSLNWGRFEPQRGHLDETYRDDVRSRLKTFAEAGQEVVLDLGIHYPPLWVFDTPHSRYVNQYGDPFAITNKPGLNAMNGVFNQPIRDAQESYVARVFRELGTNFFAVRLGWGHYSELHYAWKGYLGKKNCYWGFDPIAQGRAPGLAKGLAPCPVPGWHPGDPSEGHEKARLFLDWYLECLAQYQGFQIETLRRHFPGTLLALYANWGIRPGQFEEAISGDLNGSSFAEQYEQTQKGYDFSRFIRKVQDKRVLAYSTCVNAQMPWPMTNTWVDDTGSDPTRWSPVHFIAACANSNQNLMGLGGENDGNDDRPAMALSFQRVKAYDLKIFMWAFDFQLHDPSGRFATLDEYQTFIQGAGARRPNP